MKFFLIIASCGVIACAFARPVGAELPRKLKREFTEHGEVTIDYPKTFESGNVYHLLFWFHGTGGKPNPGISVAHADYIGVGMSYLKREHVPAGKYGAVHWQECLAIRMLLEDRGLKLGRNVVAGMSKGGWASFYVGSEVPDGPDAIAIFAAGKDPRMKDPPPMAKTLSILVGTGETDPNYPQAQLAVQYFRKGGAQVAYEEWLGLGHTYRASPRVVDWLSVESAKRDPAALATTASQVILRELQKCQKLKNPRERYLALRHLLGNPWTPHCSELARSEVLKAGNDAAKQPGMKEWIAQLKMLRGLVSREAAFFDGRSFDVPKLKTLIDRFRGLLDSAGDPGLAARAAHGARRAQKMFQIYQAQQKAFETPEYKRLNTRYRELQKAYSEAKGEPGPEVLARLKEIGAKLGGLRFKASMGSFADAEWGKKPEPDPKLDAAIRADPSGDARPYSGLGF